VIIPDPELHLFLAPLLMGKFPLIVDVHEDYKLVALDRDWIKGPLKYLVSLVLRVLPLLRRVCADVIIVADKSLSEKKSILVANIPHPLDIEMDPSPEPLRVVYVGDIRMSRGIQDMLSVAKSIPDLRLDLVGPCVASEKLLKKIEDFDLSERVIWHGRKSYKESWRIASRCAVGLSLLEETKAFKHVIPTKIWEYWALGIPVLASSLPGQANLIHEAGGGFVLNEEFSYSDFESLIHNRSELSSAGRRGRDFFLKRSKENANELFKAYCLATQNS
jgi:glycosyltransferase involved in cell wall biosynthesis